MGEKVKTGGIVNSSHAKSYIGPGSYEVDTDAKRRRSSSQRIRSASTFGSTKRKAFKDVDKNIPGPGRYDESTTKAPTYSFGTERRPAPGSHGRSRYEVRPDPGQYFNIDSVSTSGISLGGRSTVMDPWLKERSLIPAPGHYENKGEKLKSASVSAVFGKDTRADKNEKRSSRLPGPADMNLREQWTTPKRFKHTSGGSFT